jgi:hypothetical protein
MTASTLHDSTAIEAIAWLAPEACPLPGYFALHRCLAFPACCAPSSRRSLRASRRTRIPIFPFTSGRLLSSCGPRPLPRRRERLVQMPLSLGAIILQVALGGFLWNMALPLTRAWLGRLLLPMPDPRSPMPPHHQHPRPVLHPLAAASSHHHLSALPALVVPISSHRRARVFSAGFSLPPAARAFGSDTSP